MTPRMLGELRSVWRGAVSRPAFGATLVAALGGSLLSGCARSPPEDPTPAASAASAHSRENPPSLDPHTRGWEFGRWYAYQLKLTTAVSFADGPNAFDFDLTGLVQITPTNVAADVVTLYVAMANPQITSRVPQSQSAFDKVASQMAASGCFFSLSGGRITEMHTARGLSPSAANAYREVGSALQFARTLQNVEEYAAEEYDTTGQYVAEYRFDRSENVWHKRKQRYIAILAAKAAPINTPARLVPEIGKSEGDIRLLPDGHLQSADLHNTVTVNGAQQPVHSTTSLTLRAGSSETAHQPEPDWSALMSAMVRTGADEPYGAQATIESLDSARIGSVTFETAVTRFEEMAKNGRRPVVSSINGAPLDPGEKLKQEQRTEEESRLFMALSAIFREQPPTIAKAVRGIREKSPASDILIEALSAASTPATQRALIDLETGTSTDAAMRNRIIMALSRTPRPDRRSINYLKSMLSADPFREEALLGLGTYSRRLRDSGNIEQAGSIGELLVDRLRAAANTADRLTVLRAITNSGYAPALPQVIPYLTDSDELIRVDAVRALQSMKDPKVDDIIADRLNSDSSSDVRISALSAALVREPTEALTRAVESAATSSPDPHVRFRAVELLATWIPRRPDVRPVLEQVAKNDGELRVRDRAQGAL
jgi:hypothetical protein